MLASRASGAFVCIRCELRLARPRLPRPFRCPSYASFSVSISPRDALDVLDAPKHGETNPSKPSAIFSDRPLGKLRRRKGRAAIIERTERLAGVKTLGQDAAILVLRPAREVSKAAPSESVEETIGNEQDAPRILASLEAQIRKVSPEEILEQIESLRPRTHEDPNEPHYVTQAAFLKLSKVLNKSFTRVQIAQYYSSMKGIEEKSVKIALLTRLNRKDDAVDKTPWNPGQTSISKRLPGYSEAKAPKRKPASKSLMVDQILRDVWRLVMLEEIEAPGEIELTLKPWQLSLLNVGESKSTVLDRIGSSRKAKIELYEPHNVLRITADKTSAEYAADDIEEVLGGVQLSTMSLDPWLPLMPDFITGNNLDTIITRSDSEFASKVTRTHIQHHKKNTYLIRGLDKSSNADARRALLDMLPISNHVSYTLDAQLQYANKENVHRVPNILKSFLDYHARKHSWIRWTNFVARSDGSSIPLAAHTEGITDSPRRDVQLNELEKTQTDALEALSVHTRAYDYSANDYLLSRDGKWTLHPDITVSADYGSVLFPARIKAPSATKSVFSSLIPGLAKMLTANDMRQTGHLVPPFLEYEFIVDPIDGSGSPVAGVEHYPRLIMRFRPQNKAELSSVAIIFNERIHDVLLPDGAVDIRFRSSQRLRLRDPLAEPSVKEFSDQVCTNIDSGARLTAPSHLKLRIPRWVLPDFPVSDTKTVKLSYRFTQVNYRQNIETEFQNFSFNFSTLQGNKIKGKRSKLSTLFYYHHKSGKSTIPDDPDRLQFLEEERQSNESRLGSFLKTSFDIAARLTRSISRSTSMTSEAAEWTELRRLDASTLRQEPISNPTEKEQISNHSENEHQQTTDSIIIPNLDPTLSNPTYNDIDMKAFSTEQAESKTDSTDLVIGRVENEDDLHLRPAVVNEELNILEEITNNDISNEKNLLEDERHEERGKTSASSST